MSADERRALEKALRATGAVRSILDVAAGNGRWLPLLADKKVKLSVSLDVSRDQLATARESGGTAASPDRAAMICGDAGALPFATQSFDLVLCLEFMPYVKRPGRLRVLSELRRVSSRWVIVQYAHTEGFGFSWQRLRQRFGFEARFPRNHLSSGEIEAEFRRVGLGIRGFARVGGAFSRSWIVLAEAPSADWLSS